jgi:hypothetical protein
MDRELLSLVMERPSAMPGKRFTPFSASRAAGDRTPWEEGGPAAMASSRDKADLLENKDL